MIVANSDPILGDELRLERNESKGKPNGKQWRKQLFSKFYISDDDSRTYREISRVDAEKLGLETFGE
jgi:hypothetical protein